MNYKKKVYLIFLIFLIAILSLKKIAADYTIVITESLPLGLYKLTDIQEIEIGDIVQFTPIKEEMELIYSRGYLPKYAKTLLKEVVADYSNRDQIEIKEDNLFKYLYVAGKNYGPILKKDSKGREIKEKKLEELKPKEEGEYLLLSSHFKSYDSRYFGLVNRKNILKKAEIKINFN